MTEPTLASPAAPRPVRRTGPFLAGLVAALVLAVTFAAVHRLASGALGAFLGEERAREMAAVGTLVDATIDQAGRFALSHASAVAARADVAAAFAARDKAGLLKLTAPTLKTLREEGGAQVFVFHDTDLTTFLRVHRPDSERDDVSRSRPIVLAAAKSGRPRHGLEIGLTGIPAVRGVAVVRHEAAQVGTVEFGLELTPLIERVKLATGAEIALVVARSQTGQVRAEASADGPREFGDLVLSATTDAGVFRRLLTDGTVALAREPEVRAISIDGVEHGLRIAPLTDFSGRLIGTVAAVKSYADRQQALRAETTDLLVALLLGAIFAFAAFVVVARLFGRDETP